jgi:hypothetical protein
MKVHVPPLKCQGIKTKLVPWIADFVPTNFERWVEPFMGSGVVGFNLRAQNAIFADSNPHIVEFYRAIQSGLLTPQQVGEYLYTEGQHLKNAPEQGYAHYRLVRQRFNESPSPLDFLFLSRAGFNGMMRFSKRGHWNIPFCKKPDRFAQAYITKIVNQTAHCAQIIGSDWLFCTKIFSRPLKWQVPTILSIATHLTWGVTPIITTTGQKNQNNNLPMHCEKPRRGLSCLLGITTTTEPTTTFKNTGRILQFTPRSIIIMQVQKPRIATRLLKP